MQSDDTGAGEEPRPGTDRPDDWPAEGFDDFESYESDSADQETAEAQGTLEFAAPDDPPGRVDVPAPEPAELAPADPFEDTFESGFDAQAAPAEDSEDDEAVEVPEFASFTVAETSYDEDEGIEFSLEEPPRLSAVPIAEQAPEDEDYVAPVAELPGAAGSWEAAAEAASEVGAPEDPAADESLISATESGPTESGAPDRADRGEPPDDDLPRAASTEEPAPDTLTSEHYLQTTTQEFVDLAEDVARSAERTHVPSAVAAAMPGLETGVVGLEDVVFATGQDPTVIPARTGSDLALRVFTGLGLAVIFFAALYDPLLIGLFMLLVLMTAAVEYFTTVMRAGYRPVGLFGLAGALGALVGTWIWGPLAIPIALMATLVVTLIFFGMTGGRRATMTNAGLTVLGAAWIGGLGGFVFDMVEARHYGWLIVATVVTVALMDVAQYSFGRRLGRLRLAPLVSPNKTVEGLIGGVLVALIVGMVFGLLQDPVLFLDLDSPIDLGAGLAIGVAVAVAAPFGDLAVSVIKRSIGVKDMGSVLPGHGGLFDRIDAMLFAIPLTWIVFAWTGLLA